MVFEVKMNTFYTVFSKNITHPGKGFNNYAKIGKSPPPHPPDGNFTDFFIYFFNFTMLKITSKHILFNRLLHMYYLSLNCSFTQFLAIFMRFLAKKERKFHAFKRVYKIYKNHTPSYFGVGVSDRKEFFL